MSTNSSPAYAKHPEHTLTVTPYRGRVVVETPDGEVLVDTRNALALQEAKYPVVYYVPRSDTRMERLTKTAHSSVCPFKGTASYFSVEGQPAAVGENAVWSYETPFDEVAGIREALAFYGNKLKVRAEPDA